MAVARKYIRTFLPHGIDPNTDSGRAEAFRYGAQNCLSCARILSGTNATGEYILAFHALELAKLVLESYVTGLSSLQFVVSQQGWIGECRCSWSMQSM